MAERKETSEVKDSTEVVKGITGLVIENYLNSVKLALSLWEENQKVFDSQVEQLLKVQHDYINATIEFYEKSTPATLWNKNPYAINGQAEHFATFQKDYVNLVRSSSDKFAKETLKLTQKNVEKSVSIFDDYLNLFKA